MNKCHVVGGTFSLEYNTSLEIQKINVTSTMVRFIRDCLESLGKPVRAEPSSICLQLWINYREKGRLRWSTPGVDHEADITNTGIKWPPVMLRRTGITFVVLLPRRHNLKLTIRKHSHEPKLRAVLLEQLTFKNVSVMKGKHWEAVRDQRRRKQCAN